MAHPKEIKELGDLWASIYSIKDPIEFIDLLCANSYFAGSFGNKIPVDQTRTVFRLWLERKYAPQAEEAYKQGFIDGTLEEYGDLLGEFNAEDLEKRIATLTNDKEQV